MGRGYVIDSIVASYNSHQREDSFRIYVTDGLYALVNHELSYTSRWYDISGLKEKEKKEVTAQEARSKIKSKQFK